MSAFSPGGPAPGGSAAPGQPDLAELLRASARGDEQAFAELYDATSRRLYGLVLRVVRDPSQAEEVAQEAFLEIWRTSARFDRAKGSAMSWMLTIAHRKAVDRVRSAEASSRRDATYEATTQDRAYDITAEEVERSLDSQRVRQALASLTETQRGAVQLAYFGGYTHNEVAALLGIPLGTAKTRIRDGLIRLRDTLGMQS
ncbi:ECF RNA polymerase sigma factor SigK [Knoellia sp. p5-6-4]|uniref:ECF RNA polymerase sigma factor SigK n=1 Tax=unclassified Knoellia TaxID=2618719 RepID=UPI0023DBDEC1|nr:ECF RNA polymerase sigma factor SigK [Knoellia sp. p5-6-4]MDF2145338.1 ECF RNA polymerase sigma factor SigK [Knoellia sp. p5-6-4]